MEKKKDSTIPEGFEGGQGIAAEGPTIAEDSEGEENSAAEGLLISEGTREREGSAAVDLEGSKEGVSSSVGNDDYCGRESCTWGGLMSIVKLSRISSLLSESSSSGEGDVSSGGGAVSSGRGDASSGGVVRSPEQGERGKVESWSLCLSAGLPRGQW